MLDRNAVAVVAAVASLFRLVFSSLMFRILQPFGNEIDCITDVTIEIAFKECMY